MRLYPAIDILERQRRAARQGRLRRQDGLRRGPARGRARLGRGRAPSSCTSSTSTAREAGEPVNLEHLRADRRRARACRCSTAAACARAEAVDDALDAGAARVILGTAAFTDPDDARRRCSPRTARARSLVGVDVRGGHVATHGWLQTSDVPAPRGVRARCASAACAASSSPTSTTTACSTAPTARRSRGSRAPSATAALIFSGRHRHARGPRGARRAARGAGLERSTA